MTSKREQVRELLKQLPKLRRSEIAQIVGVSYQTVRNVENMEQRNPPIQEGFGPRSKTWDECNLTKKRRSTP